MASMIELTVCIRAIELLDRFLSVLFLFVGHVGSALRSSGAIISQLKATDGPNSLEELLKVYE
jgi:hypothetical protein